MLKLEKLSRSKEVSISLRPQEKFFNKTFLKALALAASLHLAAGLLFHVKPFKISGSQEIFPPVQVDADISQNLDSMVLAEIDSEEILPRHIKEPQGSLLEFPHLSNGIIEYPLERFKKNILSSENLFASIENSVISLDNDLWQTPRKTHAFIIKPAGNLALRTLTQVDTQTPVLKSFNVLFAVQIDDQTGTIFWYELKDKSINSDVLAFAEKILKSMKFDILKDSFVTTGEIEIIHIKET